MDISSFLTDQGINLQTQALGVLGTQVDAFMSDAGLGQAAGSIANSIVNGGAGFSGALQQAAENTLGGIGNSVVSNIIGSVASSPTSSDAPNYASDMLVYAPKQKFIFKVSFVFANPYSQRISQEFTYTIKSIDKPKVSFQYEELNMYNYRTKMLRGITYDPISITFYDDIQNKVFAFLDMYRQAVSPIARGGIDPSLYETRGMNFVSPGNFGSSASIGPLEGNNVNVLKSMTLIQVYANGQRANVFQFINPRLEGFDLEHVDHSDSEGNLVNCQINYDALIMSDGQTNGTPANRWGKADILGNKDGGVVIANNPSLPTQTQLGLTNDPSKPSNIFDDIMQKSGISGVVNSSIPPIVAQMKNTLLSAKGAVNQAIAGINGAVQSGVNDVEQQMSSLTSEAASSVENYASSAYADVSSEVTSFFS